jgi:hypothetical protein
MVYGKVSCDVFKKGIIPSFKTSQDNHKTFLRRFYRKLMFFVEKSVEKNVVFCFLFLSLPDQVCFMLAQEKS